MKKFRCIFILVFVFNTDIVFGEDLYCTDPHTGLHHSVNSIWPSTTFRGTYTCRITEDTKNGEPRAVLQIIQNVDENNSKEYHFDSKGTTETPNREDAYEYFETLYKLAADFDESIDKSNSETNRHSNEKFKNVFNKKQSINDENEPKKNQGKISEDDCSKYKKSTNKECSRKCDTRSNDARVYNYCPPLKRIDNDEMTAAMYRDFNKYLAQYYAHRPECNYFGCKYYQSFHDGANNDNSNSSPSEVYNDRAPRDSGYKYHSDKVNNSDNTKELFDQDYDNNWSNYDPTQTNPKQYRHEHSEETPKVSSTASHTDNEASNHMQDSVHKIEPHHHNHHKRNKRSAKNETVQETGNSTEHDESNYEEEYNNFYEEFVLKFPNSTAYSSEPTEEDVEHFYDLYYEKFPYKRPTSEDDTEAEDIDSEKCDDDKNPIVVESENGDVHVNAQPQTNNDSNNEDKKEENNSETFELTNDEKSKDNNDNSFEDQDKLQNIRNKRHSEHEHNQKIKQETDTSNYDTEYRIFYSEYVSKYPKSTAFSSQPKDDDVKHFYELYYKKFPYKQPKSEDIKRNENTPAHSLADNLKKLREELKKFGELKESNPNQKSSENHHHTHVEPDTHKKIRRSKTLNDESNYEAEYRNFYNEYISKYPKSTAFSQQPKEDDVKHFNNLYYDRFPNKQPKPEDSKKSENIDKHTDKPKYVEEKNDENPNHDRKKEDSKNIENDKSNYEEEYRKFYNRYISMYPKSTAFSLYPKDEDVKHFNNLYYDKFPDKRPKSENSEKPTENENIDKLTDTIKYVEKEEEPKYQIKPENNKDLDDPFFFLKKRPVNEKPADHDESNYEREYQKFYHEYLAEYPCSTAYSSHPKDEDVRHFYRLYYEKFPYKLPKSEDTKKTEYTQLPADTDEHNEDEQEPKAPEFITTPDDFETTPDDSEDLWAERKSRFYHQKDDVEEDEDSHRLTKYSPKFPAFRRDRINRKLGLDSPVFGKPPGSAEMKLLLSSKIEDIMRKLRERRPRLGSKFPDYERTPDEY